MQRIVVTGAAGLIGGEVCARLVARGHAVTALVHRTREVRDNDGVPVNVARIDTGDIERPLMGLNPADHDCDLVIHCAASLHFDAPKEELRRVNVAGTGNALEFARACKARFLHVSTAYVCGLVDGSVAEAPVPAGTRFANGYEASKAAAEEVVRSSGVPFAIARPSITLGDSRTGAIRDFPSLCNVFRLMARGKVPVFPAAPGALLDLVPIDHVARGLAQIAERMDAAQGRIMHLVGSAPLPADALAQGVAHVPHFPDPLVVEPADFDPARLAPDQRRVSERMLAIFGSYFRRAPHFATDIFDEVTGLVCPPTDSEWLDRLIQYGIARGYLPVQAPSGRPDNGVRAGLARPEPTGHPL